MYVYVICIHIYTYVCMYTYFVGHGVLLTCTYNIHTCLYIHMYVCIYIYMHFVGYGVLFFLHRYTYTYTFECIYAHINIDVYMNTNIYIVVAPGLSSWGMAFYSFVGIHIQIHVNVYIHT